MYFQQGDVILIPVKLEAKFPMLDTNILQHGEATGHSHKIYSDEFILYEEPKNKQKYLRLVNPGLLKHEEHKEIELPSGDYEVRIVREFDHFQEEARQVVD